MEQAIRSRYSDAILVEAQERYGIDAGRCTLLDGFESFIYAYAQSGAEFILRITHSIRRSPELVCGEVDWINYLAADGIGVARAVESQAGELVEAIADGEGGVFLCTAFVKAPGVPPREHGWSADLFEAYGRLLGQMHARSTTFEPSRPEWRRRHWDDPEMLDVMKWLPQGDGGVRDRFVALTAKLHRLPKARETYGLIHQDAHGGNMFVDGGGRITLFDFDDCAYSWYANDIAIVLFYMIANREDAPAFVAEFMAPFLTGYRTAYRLAPEWLDTIPSFLTLREIDLYAVIHRSFDVANLDDPWCARFMDGRRERIEAGAPLVEFDFRELASFL